MINFFQDEIQTVMFGKRCNCKNLPILLEIELQIVQYFQPAAFNDKKQDLNVQNKKLVPTSTG